MDDYEKYEILKAAADKAYEIWKKNKTEQNEKNLIEANDAMLEYLELQ